MPGQIFTANGLAGLKPIPTDEQRAKTEQIDNISKAEAVKQQSRQLRGNLARDLADTADAVRQRRLQPAEISRHLSGL